MEYQEGQEIEVKWREGIRYGWKKALIDGKHGELYLIKFADGSTSDYAPINIRPARPPRKR